MASGANPFTQLTRALKAAAAAGREVKSAEIKIVLNFSDDDAKETSEAAPLDEWRASRVVRANIKGCSRLTRRSRAASAPNLSGITAKPGARLHGKPGSPEFIADYAAAEKLIRDRLAGTFNGLVRVLHAVSRVHTKLAASTKAEYRRMLTKAEAEFGNMPIAALDDPRVRKDFMDWREKVARASGEREADNRLSAVSAMLTWAVERGQAHRELSARLQAALSRRPLARSFGCPSTSPPS